MIPKIAYKYMISPKYFTTNSDTIDVAKYVRLIKNLYVRLLSLFFQSFHPNALIYRKELKALWLFSKAQLLPSVITISFLEFWFKFVTGRTSCRFQNIIEKTFFLYGGVNSPHSFSKCRLQCGIGRVIPMLAKGAFADFLIK